MKRKMLLLLLLAVQLRLTAQEDDTDLREFADKKVPGSICCGIVSFRVSLVTINDYISMPEVKVHMEEDSVAPGRFRIRMNYRTKDVDSVAQYFEVPEGESGYAAKVYLVQVHFKTKAFRDAYLKKLGAAALPGKRWDFWLDKSNCRGVQVYPEGNNSVQLRLVTECGAG